MFTNRDGVATRLRKLLAMVKTLSGGQTGADRAGLDFAIKHGIPYGGWCPKGRRAEDGRIEAKYQLKESPSSNYLQRTEWNVRDSDGTMIFSLAEHSTGGSLKTVEFAIKHRKPHLHLSAAKDNAAQELKKWMQQNNNPRFFQLSVRQPQIPGSPFAASTSTVMDADVR